MPARGREDIKGSTIISAGNDNLADLLLSADRRGLADLLDRRAEELDVEAAILALHNPYLDEEGLATILAQQRLLGSYRLRRELATHRLTPEARALQLVVTLFWRDLVDVQRDARVSPRVRRAAEKQLGARLPGLSLGERIALARRAAGLLIEELGADRAPRVIAALLENPRTTEGMVVRIVGKAVATPEVLQAVARSRRWSTRLEVRRALCTNPSTPQGTVLSLLPTLTKSDLRRVSRLPSLSAAVRRRAQVLLGEEPT